MKEKESVPLQLPPPQYSLPQHVMPGTVWDIRMQARFALWEKDLLTALGYLQLELETLTIHWLRREELKFFISMIDSQVQTKPVNFLQEGLDVYLGIIDYTRQHPSYNSYRTRFGNELKRDLVATMAFMYMAGECRSKLMTLYESGEYVTPEVIADIAHALPNWTV